MLWVFFPAAVLWFRSQQEAVWEQGPLELLVSPEEQAAACVHWRAGGGLFLYLMRSKKESCDTENSTSSVCMTCLPFLQTCFSYVFYVYQLIFAIKILKL